MANKKYTKFVLGAASAALVASAVAPVASAKDFNDTKGNTHEPAIDALSDSGVITGYPDGSFLPNKTLTRSDVVKLMGKWLVSEGYKIPTDYKTNMRFTDLTSKSNDELLQYAAVVKDNGVFNGSNGNLLAGDNITRENMAVVLVRAFDQVKNIDLATFVKGQDFKKDVIDLGTAKAEARPAIDVLDFFDITNPIAPAFNPKNTTTRGQFATFLHKTINTDFSAVKADEKIVADVKAVNAKTIEVTFNAPVDAKTLEKASANVITVVAGTGAKNAGKVSQELSADGKTLTLTAENYFKGEYTVKVPFEVVKGTNGKFVSPVNQKVTVNDTVAPVLSTVKSTVKATTEKVTSITLTFDEVVTSIDTVKIGNENYSPVVTGKTATISVNLDASKAYDVTVVNATDAAGNTKDVQTAPLTITVDDVAPSITSVVAAGEDKVKVTLDKELKNDSLVLTGKVGSFTTNIVSSVKVNAENKKEYIVTLDNKYLFKNGNADTVTLTAAKGALVDGIGNTNDAEITKSVAISKDTVAPEVTNVETSVTNGKVTAFTVTYSEEVASLTDSKVYVVNSKGEILSLANVATPAVKSDDAKKVVFTLKSGLKADQYSFDLAEGFVSDKSLAANKSAKSAFVVDVANATKPVETSFTIADATEDKNVVTVKFGAKVKATGTGSALNPASYQVNGVVLPADTKIEFTKVDGVVDQTAVAITLPAGFVKENDTKAVFRVTGVETLDNKVSNAFIKTIDITDNTAPEAKSFVATDLDTITVTYSEKLAALAVAADIKDEVKLFDSKGASVAITDAEVVADKLVLTVADATVVSKLTTVATENTADIVDVALNAQKTGITLSK